ncbi:GNAT family N-acetyltransferase [bacterium]|nr:GNAT family N-acetyltransferase [bacterium]
MTTEVFELSEPDARRRLHELCDILTDCVAGGASVSFMHPFSHADAARFWTGVCDSVRAGGRVLFGIEDGEGLAATAQLLLDTPPNQAHRADVAKMLVHRRARRRGYGAALLKAVEAEAARRGRSLLVLDTISGSNADRMYRRAGWTRVGEIPDFAAMPDGVLAPTTYFYKRV